MATAPANDAPMSPDALRMALWDAICAAGGPCGDMRYRFNDYDKAQALAAMANVMDENAKRSLRCFLMSNNHVKRLHGALSYLHGFYAASGEPLPEWVSRETKNIRDWAEHNG